MSQENKDSQTEQQTQEEVETVSKPEYDAIVAERDELLQYKPKEVTEEEQKLQDKQDELWQREVELTLKEKGLDGFSSIINVKDKEALDFTIEMLELSLMQYKLENAYIPTDHAKTDEYDQYVQKNDTKGMIASKFAKLFG